MKIDPKTHHQFYGINKLTDNLYENLDLIKFRIEEEVDYLFSIENNNITYHLFNYFDKELEETFIYITPQDIDCDLKIYAGDEITFLKSLNQQLPISLVLKLIN